MCSDIGMAQHFVRVGDLIVSAHVCRIGVMLSAFLQQSPVLQQPYVAVFVLPILQIIKLELSLNNRLSHIGSKRQSWDLKVSPVLFFLFLANNFCFFLNKCTKESGTVSGYNLGL